MHTISLYSSAWSGVLYKNTVVLAADRFENEKLWKVWRYEEKFFNGRLSMIVWNGKHFLRIHNLQLLEGLRFEELWPDYKRNVCFWHSFKVNTLFGFLKYLKQVRFYQAIKRLVIPGFM